MIEARVVRGKELSNTSIECAIDETHTHTSTGKTGVTADRDKIERITLREGLY